MMGFSNENFIGLGIALSSSGFIGASFIVKKKGLWKAASFGIRAGLGGYSYLLEPLWWLGLMMMVVGEIANFVAYAFAPAVLVTPLGALSIIIRLNKLGVVGYLMCIAGCVIIVIHAPQERPVTSVQEIWNMATQTAFLLYVASVLVLVFMRVIYFVPVCGNSNVLVFIGICSLMGSLSVMSTKALGISLKLTFEGNNQLLYPETWFFLVVVMTCVLTQMNYLNRALDTFSTVVVCPVYYVMFTTLTIVASAIMFKDWDGQDGVAIVSEICGFIVVMSGTSLLPMTRDFERMPSFKGAGDFERIPSFKGGAYSPMSPTLSVRLCAGNGELHKSDREDDETTL